MTKAQLLTALATLPNDAKVLIKALPSTNRPDIPFYGSLLSELADVSIIDYDGPDAPAFAILSHEVIYRQSDNQHMPDNHLNAADEPRGNLSNDIRQPFISYAGY